MGTARGVGDAWLAGQRGTCPNFCRFSLGTCYLTHSLAQTVQQPFEPSLLVRQTSSSLLGDLANSLPSRSLCLAQSRHKRMCRRSLLSIYTEPCLLAQVSSCGRWLLGSHRLLDIDIRNDFRSALSSSPCTGSLSDSNSTWEGVHKPGDQLARRTAQRRET
jgi:hypothetical protein